MSDTDQFTDIEIFLRTIWGEARGEGLDGMHAIANVVMNRIHSGVLWWGSSVRSICLKPWQFSCWNVNDPNRAKLLSLDDSDPQYAPCEDFATRAFNGNLSELTNGATSYFDSRMPNPPPWSVGHNPCAVIGHHKFYKGV